MNVINRFFITLIALPFYALSTPAINVGALNEIIHSGHSTLAKRIYNTGDSTAFVRITVDEIKYDRNGKAEEKPLDANALISGTGQGLVSSPPRLIIPAGSMQTNRLLFTGTRETEKYYRVRYIPVEPKETQDFGLSESEKNNLRDEINTGLKVLTGFGAIITVAPETAVFNTLITGSPKELIIENKGNSSIFITGLKACDAGMKKCDSAVNVQIRPGRGLKRTASMNQAWYFTLAEGRNKKTLNTLR